MSKMNFSQMLSIIVIVLISFTMIFAGALSTKASTLDSDNDGLVNTAEDKNNNGVVDIGETNQNDPDTDKDGYNDGFEINSSSNPLDFNSQPAKLPAELDLNKDGIIDKYYTDTELLTQFSLTKVNPLTLTGVNKCTLVDVVLDKSILNCTYNLNPIPTKYTFGSDDYRAKPSSSELETRCNLEQLDSNNPYINCTSISFADASIGENMIELFFRKGDNSKDIIPLNSTAKINIILNPASTKTRELDPITDNLIERSCLPTKGGVITSCTFKLPKNVILPPVYQLGVGVDPGGNCAQKDNSLIVECNDVPVGNANGSAILYSNISGQLRYRSLVAVDLQVGHGDIKQGEIPTFEWLEKSIIDPIKDIKTNYFGAANLLIYNQSNELLMTVEGNINDSSVFSPSNLTYLSDKLPNGSYIAKLEAAGMNAIQTKVDFQFKLNVVKALTVKPNILSRTGGAQLYVIVLFVIGLLFVLIKNKKSLFKLSKVSNISLIIILLLISGFAFNTQNAQSQNIPGAPVIAGKPKLDIFKDFKCSETVIIIESSVDCTMVIAPSLYNVANYSYFIFTKTGVAGTHSEPCYPTSDVKWLCKNLPINTLANKSKGTTNEIVLGAVDLFFDSDKLFDYKLVSDTIARVDTLENNSTESLKIKKQFDSFTNTFTIGESVYLEYTPMLNPATGESVFIRIKDRITGTSLPTLKTTINKSLDYIAEYKTTLASLFVLEVCVGKTESNCVSTGYKYFIEVNPIVSVKPLAGTVEPKSDRINLIFNCDRSFLTIEKCKDANLRLLGYDNYPVFVSAQGDRITDPNQAHDIVYGLFASEPYRSNKSKFNVYYIDQLTDTFNKKRFANELAPQGINAARSVYFNVHATNGRAYARIDTSLFGKENITVSDLRFDGLAFGDNTGSMEIFVGSLSSRADRNIGVLSHELGHMIFGLADEYVESNKKTPSISYPNCLDSLTRAKTEWPKINKGIDPDGTLDPFYNEFASNLKSHVFKDPKFISKDKTLPAGSTLYDYRKAMRFSVAPEDFKISYNVTGGCFSEKTDPLSPGYKPVVWRPSIQSVMNGGNPVFGTVNRSRAEQVLSLIKGVDIKCSNGAINTPKCDQFPPCTNGANNPPKCDTYPPCTNTATNPPLCNQFKPCTNGNTNPPACVKKPVCANNATNPPACNIFPPCQNKATNAPKCDVFKEKTVTFCPTGAIFDYNLGFCADKDNVYGPFPKAISDKCVDQFPKDLMCTATKSVEINKLKYNLLVYPKARFISYRGTAPCSFNTVFDKTYTNYCIEFNAQFPGDISKADVYGPFTANTVAACQDPKAKGGSACFLNRFSYPFFKFIYKP